MSESKGKCQQEESKICKVVIQQCISANLRFDTEDEPVSIGPGMVIFVSFLQGASMDRLDNIAKAVLNAKLCEAPVDIDNNGSSCPTSAGRESSLHHKLDILVIPQATLGGKLKGKAIQYHGLVSKSLGEELFTTFVKKLKDLIENDDSPSSVQNGVYGARQILKMETNGPFTHVFEF